MNFIARKEVKAFTIVPSNLVKIVLNHNGEACGYYAVNNTDGLGLIQIYVRQEFRRQGFARKMILDFMNTYPGQFRANSLSREMRDLMNKMIIDPTIDPKIKERLNGSIVGCRERLFFASYKC